MTRPAHHAAANLGVAIRKCSREHFDRLSYRERRALELHHGLDGPARTLDEIGRTFNITPEQAQAIIELAEYTLAHPPPHPPRTPRGD